MAYSFSFTPPTQPCLTYPIWIGDSDGGNAMYFAGIQEPSVLPELSFPERHVKVGNTRPGQNHCGYRVFSSFGSSENQRDLQITLPLVEIAQMTQLQGYYDGRPGVFAVNLGGESGYNPISYLVMFKKGGLRPGNYRFNLRAFQQVSLDLYVVTRSPITYTPPTAYYPLTPEGGGSGS